MPVTKVMKYQIIYDDDERLSFSDMQKTFWSIQRACMELANRSSAFAYEWLLKKSKIQLETGRYPKFEDIYGGKEWGFISKKLKDEQSFALDGLTYRDVIASTTINMISDAAYDKCCKTDAKDIIKGSKSVPSYKSDIPISMKKQQVKLCAEGKDIIAFISITSSAFNKTHNMKNGGLKFRIVNPDGTQKAIVNRILSGQYNLCDGCQVTYDNKKWFLSLCYSFEAQQIPLDRDKILGVDLGIVKTVMASIFGSKGRFQIDGSEINHFNHIRERKIQKLKQQRYADGGSFGHGTKRRTKSAYDSSNSISNYQKTLNHRYSRAIVDYAIKNHCGVIQMEDLTGIKKGAEKMLQHWTYYDLQSKVEYKCKEAGIEFVKVDPRYTSQRCSRCGCIHDENRKTQAEFKCIECGYAANADYNASQNISIRDIDHIITKQIEDRKKCEPQAYKPAKIRKVYSSERKTDCVNAVKPEKDSMQETVQCSMFD